MVVTPMDEDVEEVAKQLLQDAARAKQALIQPSPSPSGESLAFFSLYGQLSSEAVPLSKALSQMPHRGIQADLAVGIYLLDKHLWHECLWSRTVLHKTQLELYYV